MDMTLDLERENKLELIIISYDTHAKRNSTQPSQPYLALPCLSSHSSAVWGSTLMIAQV